MKVSDNLFHADVVTKARKLCQVSPSVVSLVHVYLIGAFQQGLTLVICHHGVKEQLLDDVMTKSHSACESTEGSWVSESKLVLCTCKIVSGAFYAFPQQHMQGILR